LTTTGALDRQAARTGFNRPHAWSALVLGSGDMRGRRSRLDAAPLSTLQPSIAPAAQQMQRAGAEYVQSAQQCNRKRSAARLWSILFTSKKNNV
jgi:hypothetical protein